MSIARTRTGRRGEQIACEHMLENGYRLIERNFRTRAGEIDLIVADRFTLVICEVKSLLSRDGHVSFSPLESITAGKRIQVRRMARVWLSSQSPRPVFRQIRFDAIGIVLARDGRALKITHIEAAF